MAVLGRWPEQDADCRRVRVAELVGGNRAEVDVGKRDVLLKALEGHEVFATDSSTVEGARVDDARIQDVRA